MVFWASGRLDMGIDDLMFRTILHEIENNINDSIKSMDFGHLITSYDIVFNIFRNKPLERFKYSKKEKSTDIDVNIDFGQFHSSTVTGGCQLFSEAILYSINEMRKNKNLGGFDFDLFYCTVYGALEKHKS